MDPRGSERSQAPHPAHRPRRRPVGPIVLPLRYSFIAPAARNVSIPHAASLPGIPLYRAFGYEPTAEIEDIVLADGVRLPCQAMTKKIGGTDFQALLAPRQ